MGDEVAIEFDERDPSRSRVSGMRRAIWESPRIMVMAILGIIGLTLLAFGLRIGRGRNVLLRLGPVKMGKLIAARPTDANLDDPDYLLTFEFTGHEAGRSEATVCTNDLFLVGRLSHGPVVPVLFDPGDSSRAYLLEAEPSRPRIDEHGRLRGRAFAAVARLIQAVIILAIVWDVAQTS